MTPTFKGTARVYVTGDSKYVCVYPGTGIAAKGAEAQTVFYPVEQWQPAFTLPEVLRPQGNAVQGALFAQKSGARPQYVVYAPLGAMAQARDLSWDGNPVLQFVPQPQGGGFLIVGFDRHVWLGELEATR
jgi:hypothetical protein